jgi:hypothetical protein
MMAPAYTSAVLFGVAFVAGLLSQELSVDPKLAHLEGQKEKEMPPVGSQLELAEGLWLQ